MSQPLNDRVTLCVGLGCVAIHSRRTPFLFLRAYLVGKEIDLCLPVRA
jgi:hypothetical protein